jgi:nucleotide-binding universal stress UspA family protein
LVNAGPAAEPEKMSGRQWNAKTALLAGYTLKSLNSKELPLVAAVAIRYHRLSSLQFASAIGSPNRCINMPNDLAIDEDLVRQLPLPLAQIYRRAFNEPTPLKRHQAGFYVWEAAIKLLGAAAVLEYAERGLREANAARELQALARPSLGHWYGFSRVLVPLLAKAGEPAFQHLQAALNGKARTDLPALAALDASLRSLFEDRRVDCGPVKLSDLFDRLLRYRNDEIGHAAMGMRSDRFYSEKADALLAAVPELFGALDVLAGRKLVYVSDVSRLRSGDWEVETFELIGEAPKLTKLKVPPNLGDKTPIPNRLYLRRPNVEGADDGGVPCLGPLHPLVVYDDAKRVVDFLNAQRGSRDAEYLDYVDSNRFSRPELTAELSAFLSAVLGNKVDSKTVERWATETPDDVGAANVSDPAPLAAAAPTPAPPDSSPLGPPETAMKVMISYKRNAQPDEQLLQSLEKEFNSRGNQVFVDRHLKIGEEWAREINRQICESDAVIVLLSAASVYSEMVEEEVQIAYKQAEPRGGRPRLLPVRINFEGKLPPALASILDPLQYFLWTGPADTPRLVAELQAALAGPAPALQSMTPPTGVVPIDNQFYVVRPTDRDFQDAVARQDSFVLVRGPRQVGKTSLLARGIHDAREKKRRVVITDLQSIAESELQSSEVFYRTLARRIARQLKLSADLDKSWDPSQGANVNFEEFLLRTVLGDEGEPLIWVLDEVDRLFSTSFGSEVFGLFRSWHNARAWEPAWQRLTMVIAYATEAHLFITDLNQSPFNVGTRLSLEDFTEKQLAWLNVRYGTPLRTPAEVQKFYALVGGHPYLTNRGLFQIAERGIDSAAFATDAVREEGLFSDHLHRLLVLLGRDKDLTEVVKSVLTEKRGKGCASAESFHRLRSAGVFAGESAQDAKLRCELYTQYLKRHLL